MYHKKPAMFVNHISLNVSNLNNSVNYYTHIIGLKLLNTDHTNATLSADGSLPIVTLRQQDNIRPKQPNTTGLYHFALLVPSREDLANVVQHLRQLNIPFGSSDHLVSEAIYISDPDGNGIEIYADRSESTWRWHNGEVEMAVDPLDIKDLLNATKHQDWYGIAEKTIIGHIHLHVSDLKIAEQFYCSILEFEVVNRYGNQALFISSENYHHHIGLNTWNGEGAPQPKENSVGLHSFILFVPEETKQKSMIKKLKENGISFEDINEQLIIKDPFNNTIIIRS
ncbi:VOC family protein [Bacillus sp. HMF5848]|uniref:VOC family protein n=1 Tax=Bacillus sp. HMF5848 TaxID=2495421 RepID=UPI0021ADFA69|nr:VOC family protein [Bacillus sp. HMF5848]